MRHCSPSLAGSALIAALLLALAPSAFAQSADTLSQEDLESIDRQLGDGAEPVPADTSEGSDLWEEYQRYKTPDRDDDDWTTTGERVEIGSDVSVSEGERVRGDVVSIGGDVTVSGKVDGDAVAIGGSVILLEGAEIEGDAVSVGGRVREMGDATVHGQKVSINIPMPLGWFRIDHKGGDIDIRPHRAMKVVWGIAILLLSLLFAFAFNAVFRSRMEVVSRRIEAEPGQSFLVGLLGAFGTPLALLIVSVLLAITFIGILLIPVLLVLVVALGWAGFVAVCLAVGRRIARMRAGEDALVGERGSNQDLLVGFLVISMFGIAAFLLNLISESLGPLSFLFDTLDTFIFFFAATLGYGALLLSRLGAQLPGGIPAFVTNRPWHQPSPPPAVPPSPGTMPAEYPPGVPPPPPGPPDAGGGGTRPGGTGGQ
jgi:hypothetical protein